MAQRSGGWYWHLGVASWLAVGGAIAASGNCALAQITPDGTLGAESSVVTPTNIDGLPTERIDAGATRGAKLFHSFEQFSVPTGGTAYFNNASAIQNIISRVTGSSISNSDTVSFDGVGSNELASAALSSVEEGAVGNGGGINITTGSLSVTNGALLSASSAGSGAAGNIEVTARSIRLDNQALLSSDTTGGQGNIILNSQDLVLRRGSNITTDAQGKATGGNITLNTDILAAVER